MKIKVTTEQQTAHNKIVLAQQKIDTLTQSGKGRRDEETKYWCQQLSAWTGYANELNKLAEFGVITLTKTIKSDGDFHIRVEKRNGQYIKFLSQKHLPSEVLESITVGDDYSLNNPPCKRCGERGTQLHHWAPKELFEDAEDWPQDYLCKKHHQEWHDTITNPFRTLKRKMEKINGQSNVEPRPTVS